MNRTSKSETPKSERPEPFVIATAEPRRPSGRVILFAGVAGACALGVGAGLWARPAMHERQAARVAYTASTPAAPAAAHQLEIVVDSHPRAAGGPLDVLPPGVAAPAPMVAPAPERTFAPAPQPQGLIRTQAPIGAPVAPPAAQPHDGPSLKAVLPAVTAAMAGARLVLARLEHPTPAQAASAPLADPEPRSPPAKAAHKAEPAKARARDLEIARADAARAEAHRAALAKAEAAAEETARVQVARAAAARAAATKAEAHRLALAKVQAAKAEAHRQELARADAAKAQAAHKLALAKAAQAEKAEQVRLAKAEARAKAAQREEARLEALAEAAEAKKRAQLARLAHALAHAVTAHERPAPVEQARLDRKHAKAAAAREARLEQASLKSRRRHEAAARLVAAHPKPRTEVTPPPPPSGLMRVSTSPRCASRDAGAALVCADPGLSAAERQLARAYQGARNAGVPDAQLQMGQQRWLAARSAAAREAPWAVRDVYMARIAELNGQAREAQGGY